MSDMTGTPGRLDPIRPFAEFSEAAHAVLELLHRRFGLGLWLVTRTEGEDWIVLSADDHGYGVKGGDVFRWTDSFCSRMVQGLGPRIAPDSNEVDVYVEAPIGKQVDISAYVGVPLSRSDGTLFGTLCAIDPEPQPESLVDDLPEIELHARLLATILNAEIDQQQQARHLERAESESQTDPLTGLYNRRGWSRLLAAEEARSRRYGNPGGVMILDLDGLKAINDRDGHAAGDRLLRAAAGALRTAVRRNDVVARLGGDEFAVLAVEATPDSLEHLAERIAEALTQRGVRASLGWASRDPRNGFTACQQSADAHMYRRKREARGEDVSAEAAVADDRG